MIGLLAIIGLIVVLFFMSNALKKIGNVLTQCGDALIDYASDMKKQNRSAEDVQQKLNKIQDKIESLKGDEDAQYREKVRKEIDEITG